MGRPLAEIIRPNTLDEVVGQKHIIGKNATLRKIIESGKIPNMIFYGPSGTGKTTIANIIASQTNMALYKINATSAGSQDVKDIIAQIGTLHAQNGILLYLDEIQYFSKKQQQLLLEYIERGDITLIASTTENPYFYIYGALLSRCSIFEFKVIPPYELVQTINRALDYEKEALHTALDIEEGLVSCIANAAGGDARKAINIVELLFSCSAHYNNTYYLKIADVNGLSFRSASKFDRDGDYHYDLLSCFQKSIRGSDPQASVFYLARLIDGGDLISICRRLLVIACEDIGLAYPQAITIVKSCVDAAMQLGLPEARIPLAEAVIFLATSPKSNSAIGAIDKALEDVNSGKGVDFPAHLKDAHYQGSAALGHGIDYLYPHDYPHHYVKQQYLPDDIKNNIYYVYGDNKIEKACKNYWDEVLKDCK
jgi:putative ATPase